ncbi:MAG: GspH/FimT family pseudopilin [Betaproteobacteria bacterium]|nr:GspH/FimT family pseudopilin [Betaproteobacteria bacterium]
MLRPSQRARGFTLIELAIGLMILGILIMAGLPSMRTWLQNSQIRTASDAMISGLQLARAEALRRNTTVRFQLVTDLTASCALSASGRNWVVSLTDPSGGCQAAPSETGAGIVQARDASEGTPSAIVSAKNAGATGASLVSFSGLGRVNNAGAIATIDISNPGGGNCQTVGGGGGPMRCLRIQIGSGGLVRMCDPAVDPASTTDTRKC